MFIARPYIIIIYMSCNMFVCARFSVCVYVHVCVWMCAQCVYVYVCMCMCMYVCVCMYVGLLYDIECDR